MLIIFPQILNVSVVFQLRAALDEFDVVLNKPFKTVRHNHGDRALVVVLLRDADTHHIRNLDVFERVDILFERAGDNVSATLLQNLVHGRN